MKIPGISILIILIYVRVAGQHQAVEAITSVDSISKTNGPASVFAKLYAKTMDEIEKQLSGMDSTSVYKIRLLEKNFCNYFINACKSVNGNDTARIWHAYFKNSSASKLKLQLFGINAHINGDLWQALRDSYSKDEIKQTGQTVFVFHRSLVKIYNDLYAEAKTENKKFKTLHSISIGLAKGYGRHLLKKWRRRQIRIATNYYFNQPKFERLKTKTERKKNKIDKMINRKL